MIDKEKLDAVMVETTTHARAWIAILAMQAGMDAYIEKPMCLTIAEGRAMVKAARKFNRVTQVGTQQRSMPINNWASDLVKNGAIGKVLTVLAPNFVGPFRWTKTSTKDVKRPVEPWWDVWTNQAELRPYDDEPAPRLGPLVGLRRRRPVLRRHRLGHPLLRPDQPRPGHRRHRPGRGLLEEPVADPRHRQVRQTQDRRRRDRRRHRRRRHRHRLPRHGQAGRPAGQGHDEVRQRHGTETAPRRRPRPGPGRDLHRREGKNRDQPQQDGQQSQGTRPRPDNPGPNRRPETAYHIENWIECIKSRKPCNADIEIGQRATTLCYLVNIVRDVGRVGEPLKWDPVAERFTNCDEANKLLDRPRRKGYELPDVG